MNKDLVLWIGEEQCIEILFCHFSDNPDICVHVGKLPKQHFNVRLFSNPGDKILILVKIYLSQALRVQHYMYILNS